MTSNLASRSFAIQVCLVWHTGTIRILLGYPAGQVDAQVWPKTTKIGILALQEYIFHRNVTTNSRRRNVNWPRGCSADRPQRNRHQISGGKTKDNYIPSASILLSTPLLLFFLHSQSFTPNQLHVQVPRSHQHQHQHHYGMISPLFSSALVAPQSGSVLLYVCHTSASSATAI